MSSTELFSPILSFLGAAIGAYLVYRSGQRRDWSTRFHSALDLLAADDARKRALGRARIVQLSKNGGHRADREEALASLREDVWASCPASVRRALEHPTDRPLVWISQDDRTRMGDGGIFLDRPVADSAKAYVEIAGGADAAQDQGIARASEAVVWSSAPERSSAPELLDTLEAPSDVEPHEADQLPQDRRLILVKLNPDAAALDPVALRDRARKAWRLSLERIQAEPPEGIAAIAKQRVIGAWKFEGVKRTADATDRIEFELGPSLDELVGREYRDTAQNPVRYWP